MSSPGYRAPEGTARAEVRERGSRFLAVVGRVESAEAADAALAALAREFADATHLCWARRLGDPAVERSSDAGEPAGTAGVPILHALRGADLSDAQVVVARWFGGTKLGKGGLARAYAAAARAALTAVAVARRVPTVEIEVAAPFARVGAVKRLLRPPEVELAGEDYGAGEARLRLRLHAARRRELEEALADLGITPPPH